MILRAFVGAAALVLLASDGPGQSISEAGSAPPRAQDAARTRPAPPDVDLLAIRNIFRYGDEPSVESRSMGETDAGELETGEALPPGPARVRVVGLVRRAGTPVAALAIDGEVVLLRTGETGAGLTVLGIGDEAIRLRDPEGNETTLELP
ncbi:MAG: hypothetical protein PVJ73_17635 [Acidobacteriota bacterium]|jgi:hypothetical protein